MTAPLARLLRQFHKLIDVRERPRDGVVPEVLPGDIDPHVLPGHFLARHGTRVRKHAAVGIGEGHAFLLRPVIYAAGKEMPERVREVVKSYVAQREMHLGRPEERMVTVLIQDFAEGPPLSLHHELV
jgi:hypothetical protein